MTTSDGFIGGRYRLLEQIGKGGMGSIWLADDCLLRRRVALKQIRPEQGLDLTELRDRAVSEARAMMLVNHPAIVKFHNVFLVGQDPWIDMEYIQGDSLEAIIKRQHPADPLSERSIAQIALPILNGLRVAHAAGVLHRDVKPGNILMTSNGAVFLVDFGIARIDGDAPLTRYGRMVGTPEYMSPERIRAQPAGPPSDLWSLGVTLYYALEGESPFLSRGEAGYQATMYKVLYEEPPRPARHGRLADIIIGLLAKDPHDRASAADLDAVLQGLLDGRHHAGQRRSHEPMTTRAPDPVRRREEAAAPRPQPASMARDAAPSETQLQQVRDAVRRASPDAGIAMLLAMSNASAAKVLAGLRAREAGALLQAIAASDPPKAASILRVLSSAGAGSALDFVSVPAAVSILTALRVHEAARILNRADPKAGAQILTKLPGDLPVLLLTEMQPGSAVAVLSRVWPQTAAAYFAESDGLRRKLLSQLDPAFRQQVLRHLR